MSQKKVIVVIGAGAAGLTAAYKLAQDGHSVTVYEASPHIGGLGRSFDLWGQIVDVGPHRFFSSDKTVNNFWHEVVGIHYSMINRLTRIYYRNKFFYYPLQPLNAFLNLGPVDVLWCILSYIWVKLFPNKIVHTFEDWVTSRFGKRLFQIFFKTYTEKVWGISCAKIDADWAAQRIKKLSLFEVVRAAFFKDRKKKHKTLVEYFAYPRCGTGTLYVRMAEKIQTMGGEVLLEKPVLSVLTEYRGDKQKVIGVQLKDGSIQRADAVISTMPLTHMVRGLPNSPEQVKEACKALKFRNTILVYLEVNSKNLFPDNWIYVHSPDVQHGRITNFRNWCPSLNRDKDTSILCVEFWCFDSDAIWSDSPENLGKLAEKEIRKIGLIPPGVKFLNSKTVKISKSYPVYETGYMQYLKVVQDYVDSIEGLYAAGRYGAFKYNNQDHSILMGILVAREISTGVPQDLWSINTDTEYQEKASISETGLVPAAVAASEIPILSPVEAKVVHVFSKPVKPEEEEAA